MDLRRIFAKAEPTEIEREVRHIYQEFEWKVTPLLQVGDIEKVRNLFVGYTVEAQMKNPGGEGEILMEMDGILKQLLRKPREGLRRGRFDDL